MESSNGILERETLTWILEEQRERERENLLMVGPCGN
jgi:hypothetical protein